MLRTLHLLAAAACVGLIAAASKTNLSLANGTEASNALKASWTAGAQTMPTSEPLQAQRMTRTEYNTASYLGGLSLDKCAFYDYSKRGTDAAYGGCDGKTAADLFCAKFGFGSAMSWTTGHETGGYMVGSSTTNPDPRGLGADVLPTVTCTM